MPKIVTIECEVCGVSETAKGYSRLWAELHRQGWEKGVRHQTYYCPQHAYVAMAQRRIKIENANAYR